MAFESIKNLVDEALDTAAKAANEAMDFAEEGMAVYWAAIEGGASADEAEKLVQELCDKREAELRA